MSDDHMSRREVLAEMHRTMAHNEEAEAAAMALLREMRERGFEPSGKLMREVAEMRAANARDRLRLAELEGS